MNYVTMSSSFPDYAKNYYEKEVTTEVKKRLNELENEEKEEGEKKMLIEKKETMSFEEFIERKDESFEDVEFKLNEEKVKKFNEDYGRFMSKSCSMGSNGIIRLFPKAIEIGCRTIPISFIEEVEVTIRY